MAEALLRKHAGDRFQVHSAGLEPQGIHPCSRAVTEEMGIPLVGHRSKSVREFLTRQPIAYVITVCGSAARNCPILPGAGVRLHWPFEDPAAYEGTTAEHLDRFRQIRDQIDARIRSWLTAGQAL
jgi:arsenate reductase